MRRPSLAMCILKCTLLWLIVTAVGLVTLMLFLACVIMAGYTPPAGVAGVLGIVWGIACILVWLWLMDRWGIEP